MDGVLGSGNQSPSDITVIARPFRHVGRCIPNTYWPSDKSSAGVAYYDRSFMFVSYRSWGKIVEIIDFTVRSV